MVIYRLFDEPFFPNPEDADPDGLLAVGGDLSVERLVCAYSNGIFPWFSEDSPILWWSTDPRLILCPKDLHVPRSLRRVLNKGVFRFTMDHDFSGVIRGCAESARPDQEGTWIVDEMIEAYEALYDRGIAHSVEAWQGDELVGGLYGVSLGRIFFGESMFFRVPDASKAAFVVMVRHLDQWGFEMVDCQQTTKHLLRFGAREIPRSDFIPAVRRSVAMHPVPFEGWKIDSSIARPAMCAVE